MKHSPITIAAAQKIAFMDHSIAAQFEDVIADVMHNHEGLKGAKPSFHTSPDALAAARRFARVRKVIDFFEDHGDWAALTAFRKAAGINAACGRNWIGEAEEEGLIERKREGCGVIYFRLTSVKAAQEYRASSPQDADKLRAGQVVLDLLADGKARTSNEIARGIGETMKTTQGRIGILMKARKITRGKFKVKHEGRMKYSYRIAEGEA